MKLPKLSLKRFNGDLAKWITHLLGHIQIDGEQKPFTYEHQQIELYESTAAEAISGLTCSSANYEEAVAIREGLVTNNCHMDPLVKLDQTLL